MAESDVDVRRQGRAFDQDPRPGRVRLRLAREVREIHRLQARSSEDDVDAALGLYAERRSAGRADKEVRISVAVHVPARRHRDPRLIARARAAECNHARIGDADVDRRGVRASEDQVGGADIRSAITACSRRADKEVLVAAAGHVPDVRYRSAELRPSRPGDLRRPRDRQRNRLRRELIDMHERDRHRLGIGVPGEVGRVDLDRVLAVAVDAALHRPRVNHFLGALRGGAASVRLRDHRIWRVPSTVGVDLDHDLLHPRRLRAIRTIIVSVDVHVIRRAAQRLPIRPDQVAVEVHGRRGVVDVDRPGRRRCSCVAHEIGCGRGVVVDAFWRRVADRRRRVARRDVAERPGRRRSVGDRAVRDSWPAQRNGPHPKTQIRAGQGRLVGVALNPRAGVRLGAVTDGDRRI